MAGKTPGRRPKLTRDFERRLLKLIESGVPREVACVGAGIASRTLRIWRERARAGEEKYVEFEEKLERALAKAQIGLLQQLKKHGRRDAKATAWMLEHVFSDRYGHIANLKAERRMGMQRNRQEPVEVVIRTVQPPTAAETPVSSLAATEPPQPQS